MILFDTDVLLDFASSPIPAAHPSEALADFI